MHVTLTFERPRQEDKMFEGSLCYSQFWPEFYIKDPSQRKKIKIVTSTDIYTPSRARYGQRHFGVLWMEQEDTLLAARVMLGKVSKGLVPWIWGA